MEGVPTLQLLLFSWKSLTTRLCAMSRSCLTTSWKTFEMCAEPRSWWRRVAFVIWSIPKTYSPPRLAENSTLWSLHHVKRKSNVNQLWICSMNFFRCSFNLYSRRCLFSVGDVLWMGIRTETMSCWRHQLLVFTTRIKHQVVFNQKPGRGSGSLESARSQL